MPFKNVNRRKRRLFRSLTHCSSKCLKIIHKFKMQKQGKWRFFELSENFRCNDLIRKETSRINYLASTSAEK